MLRWNSPDLTCSKCTFPSIQIANDIRHILRDYNKIIPTVLEIPSKDQPYDPEQVSFALFGKLSFF